MDFKKYGFLALALVLVNLGLADLAEAGRRSSRQSIRYTRAAADRGSNNQWGMGWATATGLVRTTSAASALFELSDKSQIQAYLGIGTTNPLNLGFGGVYKWTVAGNKKAGFHVGGGLGLGTATGGNNSEFFIHFAGLGGVHFKLPSLKNIVINFDGGPVVSVFNGTTDFAIGSASTLLGLSVHYMF